MEQLHCVIYTSTANHLLSGAELEKLLHDARQHNADRAITGILLYSEGTFFQYLEGQVADVTAIYERIKQSRQHHSLIELLRGDIDQRAFPDWLMGFFQPSQAELLKLMAQNWQQMTNDQQQLLSQPFRGILLQQFCQYANHYDYPLLS